MKIYAICTLMRTGSSLLCQYLTNTGLLGRPIEYFSTFSMHHFGFRELAPIPMTYEFMQKMIDKYSSNGIFGIKIPYQFVVTEIAQNTLEELFPVQLVYVYMNRENKLQQAISASRGFQTRKWYSNQKDYFDVAEVYSRNQICRFLESFAVQEKSWEEYFSINNATPLRISYEKLIQSSESVVREIISYIGLRSPKILKTAPIELEKQADEISIQWEKRYMEDKK